MSFKICLSNTSALHNRPYVVRRHSKCGRRIHPIINQLIDSRVTGTWQKDIARSTPMDALADMVGLTGLVKEGIKLIRGCEIAIEGPSFRMGVFSVVPLVKINERYALDGAEGINMRRDLRFGEARCKLEVTAEGMPRLRLNWDDPYGGEGLDEFQLKGPDELHVVSTVSVKGRTETYTSVHTRKV